MWHDPLALAAATQKEAYHRDFIKEAVNMNNVVEQYLSGNKVALEPAPPLLTGVRDVRTRLPMMRRYEKDIVDGNKISRPVSTVREQDVTLRGGREGMVHERANS